MSSPDRHVIGVALKTTRLKLTRDPDTIFDGIMPVGTLHVTGPSQPLTAEFRAPCDFIHFFEGQKIDGRAPHTIGQLGIARTFQNTELFGQMSAIENVLVGLDRHHSYNLAIGMAHGPGYRRSEVAARREAQDLLDLVGIPDDAAVTAASLPFGKQRRLEIARALATRPKLLLLDEPAAGLRAAEVESLNQILLHLRAKQGLTILVIDHVMALVMAISDRISVLNFGRKIAEGDPDAVRKSSEVIRAYLGDKGAHALGA